MKSFIKYLSVGTVTGILLLAVGFHFSDRAIAKNALNVVTTNTTRPLATTTLNYMSAGTATTTFQLYTADIDQIGFNILLNASSSATTLKWRYEYSVDGTNWFAGSIENNINATTTVVVRDFVEYSWLFASSTAGSSQSAQNISTGFKHVDLYKVGSQFTRAVFYLPPGSTPGAVYVQAVLKAQNAI